MLQTETTGSGPRLVTPVVHLHEILLVDAPPDIDAMLRLVERHCRHDAGCLGWRS
jgi:hypothetical protein